jgi:hypothetical protein
MLLGRVKSSDIALRILMGIDANAGCLLKVVARASTQELADALLVKAATLSAPK